MFQTVKGFLRTQGKIFVNETQFALLDRYLDWCEEIGLYVIMDLHAACAGQSAVSCDDGVDIFDHDYDPYCGNWAICVHLYYTPEQIDAMFAQSHLMEYYGELARR